MNPFNNPTMFENMKKNMNPEMMRNATQQMNNMSDDDLKRMGQQSGMNFSPEMMRMAAGMFNNMDDNQMKNMMNMAGNMNPGQFQQQQQQPQQQKQNTENTQNKKVESSKPAPQPIVDNSLFPSINKLKNEGNDKFKAQDWEGAASNYLEAIISIEEEKLKKINGQQEKELKDMEINCRNNYCSVKAKQQDYHSLLIQAQAVLKLDQNNTKAKFRLGQGYFGLKKYEKAIEYLTDAKNASPNDQISKSLNYNIISQTMNKKTDYLNNLLFYLQFLVYTINVKKKQIKSNKKLRKKQKKKKKNKKKSQNVSYIKVHQKQYRKSSNKPQEEKIQKNETKEQEKPKPETKKIEKQDVVIEEVKEQPKPAAQAQQQFNSNPYMPQAGNMNPETIKQAQEKMKNMSNDEMDRMANMMKGMDTQTLKSMYKSQGIDMSDQQIDMMKNMISPDMMRSTANADPELVRSQAAQQAAQRNTSTVQNTNIPPAFQAANNKEAIKKSQEQLKNMDDSQISNMANMVKNMDNSFLKQMYKSQGMDLTDEQLNMMKNMMTPEMIKTASSMDPNSIPSNQMQQTNNYSQDQTQNNGNVNSEPQVQAQQMPDMSNMEGMLENTQMIETALNMVIANPEMLKMMASQFGPNHPIGSYLQRSSPEDLKKLVNKLKYLIPVFKYGYKGFKFVQKYKAILLTILIAFIFKYFFL